MTNSVRVKLQQLRSLLHYHKTAGITGYPRTEDIAGFLRAQPLLPAQKELSGKKEGAPENEKQAELLNNALPNRQTIAEISEEVSRCTSCELHLQRVIPVNGAGGVKAKLFIVGDWLKIESPGLVRDAVFGQEEDLMVERMLKAIHLTPAEAFITNVIKCGVSEKVQPQATHIETCLSYVERQIAAISPEIICTMGSVATRTLLKVSQPLSQLRGKFHEYRIDEKRKIPLMPTYHPSFLLRNPEMKQATWADLQLIQKRL